MQLNIFLTAVIVFLIFLVPSYAYSESDYERELEILNKNTSYTNLPFLHVELKKEISKIAEQKIVLDETNEVYRLNDVLHKLIMLNTIFHNDDKSEYDLIFKDWKILRENITHVENVEELFQVGQQISELHDFSYVISLISEINSEYEKTDTSEFLQSVYPLWNELRQKIEELDSVEEISSVEEDVRKMTYMLDVSDRIWKKNKIYLPDILNDPELLRLKQELLSQIQKAQSISESHNTIKKHYKNFQVIEKYPTSITGIEHKYRNFLKQKNHNSTYNIDTSEIERSLQIIDIAKKLANENKRNNDNDITMLMNLAEKELADIERKIAKEKRYEIKRQRLPNQINVIETTIKEELNSQSMPEFDPLFNDLLDELDTATDYLSQDNVKTSSRLTTHVYVEFERLLGKYSEIEKQDSILEKITLNTEQKKEAYHLKLAEFSQLAEVFNVADSKQKQQELMKLLNEAKISITLGNFITANEKIHSLVFFFQDKIFLDDPRVVLNIDIDEHMKELRIDGSVYKHSHFSRGIVEITLYDIHLDPIKEIQIPITREGEFSSLLHIEDMSPGIHVVGFSHLSSKEYKMVNINEKYLTEFTQKELQISRLAQKFEKLVEFVSKFDHHEDQAKLKFYPLLDSIENKLVADTEDGIEDSLNQLVQMIDILLSVYSEDGIITGSVMDDHILLSGIIKKSVLFREDIFITIFDHDGMRVTEMIIQDDGVGNFQHRIPKITESGLYVIQLEYHDVVSRDIIVIP